MGRALFDYGTTQPEMRCAVRHFERGHRRCEQCNANARSDRLDDRKLRDDDLVHGDDEVEIVDGPRDERDELAANHHAEQQADTGPHDSEHRGLGENHREHTCTRGSERSQHTNDAPALHDSETDGTEDEKDANQQRKQTHRLQVRSKRGGHVEALPGATLGRMNLYACRQASLQMSQCTLTFSARGHPHVDA